MGRVMMSERELIRIEVLAQVDDGRLSFGFRPNHEHVRDWRIGNPRLEPNKTIFVKPREVIMRS